jgi:hypothetical protein
VTFVYGPPEVLDTFHWLVIPGLVEKPFAAIVFVAPAQIVEEFIPGNPLKYATGEFGVPAHEISN